MKRIESAVLLRLLLIRVGGHGSGLLIGLALLHEGGLGHTVASLHGLTDTRASSRVHEVNVDDLEEVVSELVGVDDWDEAEADNGALLAKRPQATDNANIESLFDLRGLARLEGIGILLVGIDTDIDLSGAVVDLEDDVRRRGGHLQHLADDLNLDHRNT